MVQPGFDPYAVLGVARNASAAEIRTAYLGLVARYHPDHHQGNPLEGLAADKMSELNQAWEILSDPERRAAYDRGESPGTHQPFAAGRGGVRRRRSWLSLLGLLLFLPLVIRLLMALGRVLSRVFSQGLTVLGGPAGLLAVVLILVIAVLLIIRHRRGRR